MGFLADRPMRHRPRAESLDNFFCRLDLLNWHRIFRNKLKQASQRVQPFGLVVDQSGVLGVLVGAILSHRVLEQRHRLRIPQVSFTIASKLVLATEVDLVMARIMISEGISVSGQNLLCDDIQAYAPNP